MTRTSRPVRATILFGVFGALGFAVMNIGMGPFFLWSREACFFIWLLVAGYGVLLTRRGEKRLTTIVFPLLFLFFSLFAVRSSFYFILLCLMVLGWIRSGICFQGIFLKRLGIEMLLCLGAGGLISLFAPYSVVSWALGIWMFFLIQALYFILFDDARLIEAPHMDADPFEQARKEAEKILSSGFFT